MAGLGHRPNLAHLWPRLPSVHFGKLGPGTCTMVLLAIERPYLNLPEAEQLARAQIGTEVVHVERSTTNTVEFALP